MTGDNRPADEHHQQKLPHHSKKQELDTRGTSAPDTYSPHRGPHHHSNPSLRTFAHDLSSDPTDFEGQAVLWEDDEPHDDPKKKSKGKNAVQGASAAGARAITMQFISFYFRYPVKSFLRVRVDYLAVARAINPGVQANEPWSLRQSSVGILSHAVKVYGWKFIPNQVLPPLLANTSLGVLVYTSYLHLLARNHEPTSHATKRAYPPPPYWATFTAGAGAGALQSLFAAPLDALSYRFDVNELTKHESLSFWAYGKRKLAEIGLQGVFAGYSLSLVKEALGYGFFFSSFEYIKQQAYYSWLSHYYGHQHRYLHPFGTKPTDPITIIKPHWSLEPIFILLAGAGASFTSQAIFFPMNQIQNMHLRQLDYIDRSSAMAASKINKHSLSWLRRYSHAYQRTYRDCKTAAQANGGWRRWLYSGYLLTTVKSKHLYREIQYQPLITILIFTKILPVQQLRSSFSN
ncbi:hypothetical protein TWF694_005628 [Orbilia ellipsospora]|uniref:Mitochondrial carrier protein n=1 Tax=Orbilia ellipsospora TaxID=2528407 RepID=A0AAV9WUZ7_9PEZI